MNRRFIILRVQPQGLCDLMGAWKHHTKIGLPSIREAANDRGERVELPIDMDCQAVSYDYLSDTMQFRMTHHSFAEVPDGECGPVFSGRGVYVEVANIVSGTGEQGDPIVVNRPLPTVEELDAILNSEDGRNIVVNPDGTITEQEPFLAVSRCS